MKKTALALSLSALAFLALPNAAPAQMFYVGGGFSNVGLGGDLGGPNKLSDELGFLVDFGFRSAPFLALDFTLGGSRHQENLTGFNADYSFFGVGPKFIFPNPSPLKPYLAAGASFHDITYDFGFPSEISGWGYYLGGGLEGAIAPMMSLSLDARWHKWSSDAGGNHWDIDTAVWSLLFNFNMM